MKARILFYYGAGRDVKRESNTEMGWYFNLFGLPAHLWTRGSTFLVVAGMYKAAVPFCTDRKRLLRRPSEKDFSQ